MEKGCVSIEHLVVESYQYAISHALNTSDGKHRSRPALDQRADHTPRLVTWSTTLLCPTAHS
jgi:hypothetical protein